MIEIATGAPPGAHFLYIYHHFQSPKFIFDHKQTIIHSDTNAQISLISSQGIRFRSIVIPECIEESADDNLSLEYYLSLESAWDVEATL
jgi:hypothetical protein